MKVAKKNVFLHILLSFYTAQQSVKKPKKGKNDFGHILVFRDLSF